MDETEIARFVQDNVEPLPSAIFGPRYRICGRLTDGTYLPCIVVQSRASQIDLAITRFEQTKNSQDPFMGYRAIIGTFVARQNVLWSHSLASLDMSKNAIPLIRMREIRGETSMGWTQFTATMSDGSKFVFGSTFNMEFFEMPNGYTANEIVKISPAPHGGSRPSQYFKDMPFFTCYIDGLNSGVKT